MLKIKLKDALLTLTLLGTVGCTTVPRTMTINTGATVPQQRPVIVPAQRPPIKEEIFVGRNGGKNNTGLGARVDVPVNTPTIDQTVQSAEENLTSAEEEAVVDRGIMERMPFPEEEYRHIKKRGSSTVRGKVYLENVHSSQKIVKGKVKLWLNPVTSYSRQWYEESYLGHYKLSKTDKRLYNYLKFTYSNDNGSFDFYGVPRGDYYLTATIRCGEECGFAQSKSTLLVKEVTVGGGTTTVNLMKNVP